MQNLQWKFSRIYKTCTCGRKRKRERKGEEEAIAPHRFHLIWATNDEQIWFLNLSNYVHPSLGCQARIPNSKFEKLKTNKKRKKKIIT